MGMGPTDVRRRHSTLEFVVTDHWMATITTKGGKPVAPSAIDGMVSQADHVNYHALRAREEPADGMLGVPRSLAIRLQTLNLRSRTQRRSQHRHAAKGVHPGYSRPLRRNDHALVHRNCAVRRRQHRDAGVPRRPPRGGRPCQGRLIRGIPPRPREGPVSEARGPLLRALRQAVRSLAAVPLGRDAGLLAGSWPPLQSGSVAARGADPHRFGREFRHFGQGQERQ